MQTTIGIDPGIATCGVAEFRDGILAGARLVRAPRIDGNDDVLVRVRAMASAVSLESFSPGDDARIVIEWPRVYMPGKSRGDNNDLLLLSAVAGALGALAMDRIARCDVEAVTPEEWRYGQVKKNVAFARVLDRMSADERRTLGDLLAEIPVGQRNHVEDAVGIGMYALARTRPRLAI